jgi:hypothetical protein
MKKALSGIVIVLFILSLLPYSTSSNIIFSKIQALTPNDTLNDQSQFPENLENQDGRLFKKLEWCAPNTTLPGTYKEYLLSHPLTPARFSTPQDRLQVLSQGNTTLAILVCEDIYLQITTALDQYISDVDLEGYTVFLQTVSGGTPEDIKTWITARYHEGVCGILLIGDVTAAWAEVSGDVFPSDLFYMDLDGHWADDDHDGDYEVHDAGSGDMGPEVYVGRIYATTLTYDTEANMVNDYFSKAHAYRTGKLTQPWRGLEYVEEDWYDMDVNLDLVYGNNVTRYDYGYFTTAEDYLNQMDLGQHFVQVCVHSYSGGHYFSTRPTESAAYAHIYVYSPTTRVAKLLLGSDDGIKAWVNGAIVCVKDRYGGWTADKYEANVTLHAGWNDLLCKVSQDGGDYHFSARFTDINEITFNDLTYQINNPAQYGGEAEYIRSFLLNGFHQDTSDRFWEYLSTNYLDVNEGSINPHPGDMMGGQLWTLYDSGNPYINMAEHCNNADYGVCYAFARVYASTETSCQFWTGYDDGARVWLNGQEVLIDNRYGGFSADMTKVNVTLQAGENRLLLKISEWMGDHGFSARFCNTDGSAVNGLTYDPTSTPITHIGTWLVNGPYVNPTKATRLSTDYLGNEGNVTPSQGDTASFGTWERGIGNGCPFNLGGFFDHGAWVLSQDIQSRDPPVLFYNLFACGPGRFTDENYLAGSYVFHTTYGLITVASSKSGSMLNFNDFTQPLSEGKSIGESFREWFDAQAPYVQWEKEWYYGMVVFGDPTLCIQTPIQMKITKPENAVYLRDNKIISFPVPLGIGKITIETFAACKDADIEKVEFYVDNSLQSTDSTSPYSWTWNTPAFLRHNVKVIAYDTVGHNTTRELNMWKFF